MDRDFFCLEQAAWGRIYREGVDQLPPLERSLADWEAREADLQLTRMRLVEHFTSVSGHYISERPDFDRFAEMLLLVEEAIGWIEDKPWKGQPSLGPQRVELRLGRALPVRPRLSQYRSNRREAMQVFMQELEQALVGLMPDASRETTTEAGELWLERLLRRAVARQQIRRHATEGHGEVLGGEHL